jgi:hypothetical protein
MLIRLLICLHAWCSATTSHLHMQWCIIACEKGKLWSQALELFDRMAAEGATLVPDRVSTVVLHLDNYTKLYCYYWQYSMC